MPNKEDFQTELAAARGAGHLDIVSGQVHRTLGGYSATKHQMPSCCDAMYDAHSPATRSSCPRRADAVRR